jgi:hypothetical protein
MQISVAIAGERFPGERDADHRQASGLPWSRVCRMAPASGRAQWRSRGERRQVEGDADHRQPIGLPVVKGVPDGARVGPRSVAIAGERCQGRR